MLIGFCITLVPLLVVGVLYFFVRIAGKYGGAYLGCLVVKKPKPVRNYLGLALIPQAGVAIGLAALAARTIGGTEGAILQTVILSSSILYELIGPACAKLSLYLSKSYGQGAAEELPPELEQKDKVLSLKEQLLKIEQEIRDEEYARSEEERAFNEAAQDEFSYSDYVKRYGKYINRR